jgi:hypothetical protein
MNSNMCLYSFLQNNRRNEYFSFSIGYISLKKKKKKQHEMGIFILVIKFNMDALIFVLFFIQSHLIIVCLKS